MSKSDDVFYKTMINANGEELQIPIYKIDCEALKYRVDGIIHLLEILNDFYLSDDMMFSDDFVKFRDSVQSWYDFFYSLNASQSDNASQSV